MSRAAVAPPRQVVFAAQNMPPKARERLPATVEVFGHKLSIGVGLGRPARPPDTQRTPATARAEPAGEMTAGSLGLRSAV